jgi:hypothetical protein
VNCRPDLRAFGKVLFTSLLSHVADASTGVVGCLARCAYAVPHMLEQLKAAESNSARRVYDCVLLACGLLQRFYSGAVCIPSVS